jgi:pseudouridine synthase
MIEKTSHSDFSPRRDEESGARGERAPRRFSSAHEGGRFQGNRDSDNRRPYERRGDDRQGGERRPYERRDDNRAGGGERRPYQRRDDNREGGERRPYPKRDDNREGGERRPYQRRDDNRGGGERRPYPRRDDNREGGERRPYQRRDDNREGGERRPYQRRDDNREGGERRPYQRRDDNRGGGERRPYPRRDDNREGSERRPYPRRDDNREGGERRPYQRRDDNRGGGERRPYQRRDDNREGGEKKPYQRRDDHRDGGERRPYEKRGGDKNFREKRPRFNAKPAADAPQKDEIRLNKYIANSGVCSRREADQYIAAGLVTVNGIVVTQMGVKVKSTDDVRFNDERLKGEEKVYILMNKPKDFVTTTEDPNAEKTVLDIIGDNCPQRVYPVGRLDKATTGVLLITNDGALTEQLTHPSYNRKKIYEVKLDKNLKQTDLQKLVDGIELEDGTAHVDVISYLDEDESKLGVEIHSGRNRIIRRMFEHLGYNVKRLDRVYFAGLTKKKLRRGAWRHLTDLEVSILRMGSYE